MEQPNELSRLRDDCESVHSLGSSQCPSMTSNSEEPEEKGDAGFSSVRSFLPTEVLSPMEKVESYLLPQSRPVLPGTREMQKQHARKIQMPSLDIKSFRIDGRVTAPSKILSGLPQLVGKSSGIPFIVETSEDKLKHAKDCTEYDGVSDVSSLTSSRSGVLSSRGSQTGSIEVTCENVVPMSPPPTFSESTLSSTVMVNKERMRFYAPVSESREKRAAVSFMTNRLKVEQDQHLGSHEKKSPLLLVMKK